MSGQKFDRQYEIRIKTPDGTSYTIKNPISAVIDVDRSVMSSVNNSSITLYNLAPETRNALYKDKYAFQLYWQMSIVAGYAGTDLYEIFRGNIQEAYSYKQGADWITKIDAYDGAFQIQNGFVNETMQKGISLKDAVARVVHTMPELLLGVLGAQTEATTVRGQTVVGPSYDEIQKMTKNTAFIDNETIHVLNENEIIAGDPFVLDGDNLFTTPMRRDTYLEVQTLFSPEIRVGYGCQMTSSDPRFNGLYAVLGVKHSLTVSGATAGDAITTISLNAGARSFVEVSK